MAKAAASRELRVPDLAEALGLPTWTVRRLIEVGVIRGAHRYPRGQWRLPADRLQEAREAVRKAGYGA